MINMQNKFKLGKKGLVCLLAVLALGIPAMIAQGNSAQNAYRRAAIDASRPLLVGNVRGVASVEVRVNNLRAVRVRGVSERMNSSGTWVSTVNHTFHRFDNPRTTDFNMRTTQFSGPARSSVRLRSETQRLLANSNWSTSLFASRAW